MARHRKRVGKHAEQEGTLVDRSRTDAMITEPASVVERVVRMVETGKVPSVESSDVTLDPGTICFHADTPEVIAFLEGCHAALKERGVLIRRQA
jgi:UPF0271 protein